MDGGSTIHAVGRSACSGGGGGGSSTAATALAAATVTTGREGAEPHQQRQRDTPDFWGRKARAGCGKASGSQTVGWELLHNLAQQHRHGAEHHGGGQARRAASAEARHVCSAPVAQVSARGRGAASWAVPAGGKASAKGPASAATQQRGGEKRGYGANGRKRRNENTEKGTVPINSRYRLYGCTAVQV